MRQLCCKTFRICLLFLAALAARSVHLVALMRWNFFWLCSIAIPDFSDCSSRIEAKSFTFYCESSNCLAKILLYLWSAKKKLRSHFRVIFVEVVRKFLHTVLMTFRHENICKLGHYGSNYSHLTVSTLCRLCWKNTPAKIVIFCA